MQKIATNIFIGASLAFAVLGTLIVLTEPGRSSLGLLLTRSFMITVLIILSSFAVMVAYLPVYAVRVASKYLRDGNEAK